MIIEFFTAAAECDPGVTWPHVGAFGVLMLGIVGIIGALRW